MMSMGDGLYKIHFRKPLLFCFVFLLFSFNNSTKRFLSIKTFLYYHTLSLPKTICLLGCSLNAVRDDSKNENFQATSVILDRKFGDEENVLKS